jgi:hypothetical protein
MRQSVDVTRLSRIALSNLEREGDGSDYTAVEMQPGDVRIETADAELDFVDERDDGARVCVCECWLVHVGACVLVCECIWVCECAYMQVFVCMCLFVHVRWASRQQMLS